VRETLTGEIIVLIHGGKVILSELGEALGLYAQAKLRERHVEIKLGAKVIAYVEGAVRCSDGEAIPTQTLVWAAGVRPVRSLKTFHVNSKREE
jgi:NADH dehydrogenase